MNIQDDIDKYCGSLGDRTFDSSRPSRKNRSMSRHGMMRNVDCGPLEDVRINRIHAMRKDEIISFACLKEEALAELTIIKSHIENLAEGECLITRGRLEVVQDRMNNLINQDLIQHMTRIAHNLHTGIFNDDKDATLPETSKEGDDVT